MVAFSKESLIIARLFGAISTYSRIVQVRRFEGCFSFESKASVARNRIATHVDEPITKHGCSFFAKITEGGEVSIYIYIYMYGSIDRQNGEIRIRESVEKEISISSCRNGYAAVNRLVAPSPHKYSIKFIRTNISSSRPTREKSYHDLRPRFIPGD